ncbi:hypothetical protein [Streptosporangium sp. KLBMP 9127]|nr:hypothetical protein [Streptosporangium sp. KLBMP 9127]
MSRGRLVFPSRLLLANLFVGGGLYLALLVVIACIALGIGTWGDLTSSVWEKAMQFPRWYALFVGVYLIRMFLPVYIAHGRTRRAFAGQAALFLLVFAPVLAVLMTLGYVLEGWLYGVGGWPHALSDEHLFAATGDLPLVFVEHWAHFMVWLAAGALLGAAFYRLGAGGVLLIPVAVALAVPLQSTVGAPRLIPLVSGRLALPLPETTGMVVLTAAGAFLVALLLTWAFVRDMPIRNPA